MIYCKIKNLLKKNNKTKYWLVNELETDYKSLNKLLDNSTTSIHFDTLEKLCKAFHCTLDDLFEIK